MMTGVADSDQKAGEGLFFLGLVHGAGIQSAALSLVQTGYLLCLQGLC